ncbi:MAG: acetylxylan esterase [Planctomycetaceae bacterium]|nr:acetylxylan esterase [Planctomycetaceae bacterium]
MSCTRLFVGRDRTRCLYNLLGIVLAGLIPATVLQAAPPRVLPDGAQPADVRLGPLRDLDGYFPFTVSPSREHWEARAAEVRQRLLVALGLWPEPARTPLNPVIHSPRDQGDYTIEKVYFESIPGFFVTGSLYRPKGKPEDRCPGVLCPHGHWTNGRFYDCGPEEIKKEIVQGAERFADGGRSPLQSRCVQLARMGCVVFHYDMIGYADSQQITLDVIHGFKTQRPEMNRPRDWGLFSPQAESHLQSAMGLQTWNSIRALDFLLALPDVDTQRIGVTGASGGGTQTFVLSAIDPRVQVACPAVMVSTAMQGGCTCENASLLRVGTGNIEFAAMFAPKPLFLTGANDWTKEMETKGFPELKNHYALFEAADQLKLVPLVHFLHNYNYVSRAAMYSWLNTHFQLGWSEPVVEEDYQRLTAEELTVWDAEHPQPEGGPEFERRLLAWWTADAARQLGALEPHDADSLRQYQDVMGRGIRAILRPLDPDTSGQHWECVAQEEQGTHVAVRGLLTRKLTPREQIGFAPGTDLEHAQEQLPLVLLRPQSPTGRTCLIVSPEGKQTLVDADGQPTAAVQQLLAAGICVCGVDLLYQGEFLPPGEAFTETRRVPNPREAAAYTFGYNPAVFAERVHDIATVAAFLQHGEYQSTEIDLLALPGAGHWAVAARALLGTSIARLAADTAGFRFAQVSAIHDPNFLPGGAKYDDLPGMLAVAAPAPLFLAGEGDAPPELVASAYRAANAPEALQAGPADATQSLQAAINWLLGK